MNPSDVKLVGFQDMKGFPGAIPHATIVPPMTRHTENRIQQVRSSSKPQVSAVLPSTQPNQAGVPPRTTPQHVSGVRVMTRKSGTQKTVTVQFRHPAGDPYFAGANVYLRKSGQQPTLVAGGAKSPLTFTAPVHQATHTVFVTSVGNWGETAIKGSPAHHVRLT